MWIYIGKRGGARSLFPLSSVCHLALTLMMRYDDVTFATIIRSILIFISFIEEIADVQRME